MMETSSNHQKRPTSNRQRPTANDSVGPEPAQTGECFGQAGSASSMDSHRSIEAQPSHVVASGSTVGNQSIPNPTASDPTISSAAHSADSFPGSVFSSSRIVFTLIACLLLFTAVAKLWMLLTDPFADVRVGIFIEILWFSVLFEFALAFLNLRLKDVKVLAFINTFVFTSFGLFATARWLMGYGACGCSGNLELPAWVFILIDGAIVAWFVRTLVARDRIGCGLDTLTKDFRNASFGLNWLGLISGFLVAGVILFLFFAKLATDKPVFANNVDLGKITQKANLEFDVQVQNHSQIPVNIVGVKSSCNCLTFLDRPVMILPGQTVEINGIIGFRQSGRFLNRVVLFLDHPQQRTVAVDIFGDFE
jgi:hypothetical protein